MFVVNEYIFNPNTLNGTVRQYKSRELALIHLDSSSGVFLALTLATQNICVQGVDGKKWGSVCGEGRQHVK